MATPATLKQIEERQKAQERRVHRDGNLMPLSSYGSKGVYNNYRTPKIDFTDDHFGGRQYTSFEKPRNEGKGRNNGNGSRTILAPQVVEEVPLELDTDDYQVDINKLVCFSGKQHFLSTLYPSKIRIDDNEYLSVEHYYQACKIYSLAGSQHALELRNIVEPIRVKVAAKRMLKMMNVSTKQVDEWKLTHGFVMLHHAMIHKFEQNADLRKKLLDTGDSILAHAYDRDTFFACGMNETQLEDWAKKHNGEILKIPEITKDNLKYVPLVGDGKNLAGAIAMKVRKDLKSRYSGHDVTMDKMAVLMQSKLSMTPTKG
jgi:ribA/ribD-fused uncharacterized protein